METFCETVQFYLRHLEDSLYPVMTEDQFAVKLFPMYRYFVTVWLRHQDLEVRLLGSEVPVLPGRCCRASVFSVIPGAPETLVSLNARWSEPSRLVSRAKAWQRPTGSFQMRA